VVTLRPHRPPIDATDHPRGSPHPPRWWPSGRAPEPRPHSHRCVHGSGARRLGRPCASDRQDASPVPASRPSRAPADRRPARLL